MNGRFDVVRKVQGRFADVVYLDSADHDAVMGLGSWPEIDSVGRMPRVRKKAEDSTTDPTRLRQLNGLVRGSRPLGVTQDL